MGLQCLQLSYLHFYVNWCTIYIFTQLNINMSVITTGVMMCGICLCSSFPAHLVLGLSGFLFVSSVPWEREEGSVYCWCRWPVWSKVLLKKFHPSQSSCFFTIRVIQLPYIESSRYTSNRKIYFPLISQALIEEMQQGNWIKATLQPFATWIWAEIKATAWPHIPRYSLL